MIFAKDTHGNKVNLYCLNILNHDYHNEYYDNITLDLVNIFSTIYAYDIKTPRKLSATRSLDVTAKVSRENLELWKRHAHIIIGLAEFVTEDDNDKWSINFEPINYYFKNQQIHFREQYDNVSLLSGGLDSFCGVSENEKNGNKTIYCGYKTNNIDASYINKVSQFALQRCPNNKVDVFNRIGISKVTPTQRTRSLLFFSLACLSACVNNVNIINIYENGIMTLNPSFESRATTKTTHPKTIYLFQSLINSIGLDITIKHPFLFSTKGEILKALDDQYRKKIQKTRSCSKSMQAISLLHGIGLSSCGKCVPCLLRKISLAANGMERYDCGYSIQYEGRFDDEDYRSSFGYFENFYDKIENDTIFSEVMIKRKYYSDLNYIEKTYDLLQRFKVELETFFSKYGR